MKERTDSRIRGLVGLLVKSYDDHAGIIKTESGSLLNRSAIIEAIEKLRRLIFPGYFGKKNVCSGLVEYYAGDLLEEVVFELGPQIERALLYRKEFEGASSEYVRQKAEDAVMLFLSELPKIRDYLANDVYAAFDGDPAAFSKDEIISSYPGIYAIMVSRAAHELFKLGIPLIPRIMTEHAHSVTGIDIHPGATIGHHFFIDHGTGIVIGETTVIGNYVKLYQGVTLGALSTSGGQTLKGSKRHPTIEDYVTIYSGASILGGETVIGEGVLIGSNSFVTKSVPPRTRVSVKNIELQFKMPEQRHWENTEFSEDKSWDWVI